MKKKLPNRSLPCKECSKAWRSVRLACAFMLVFGLTARSAASPQGQRVTLDLKQGTFFELFDEIHKQTGLRFVYNTDQLRQLGAIDVKAENTIVSEVLTNILRGGNLTFVVENDVVMLLPRRTAAQNPATVVIEGTVSDSETGEPLVGCLITIPALDLWTVSDADGKYRFASAPTGSYNIESTHVGYEKLTYSVTVTQTVRSFTLKMKQSSLELNTVTVTATAENTMNSSSRIDRQAMEHTQPTSLSDLMQLLPGATTTNPNLSGASYNEIVLRDINRSGENLSHVSNRNGVGIWINGAQISDQASMVSNLFTGDQAQATNRGYDTRRISLENIESIEVIPGIASAKYGNISSGAVIVNTIKGRTPWDVKFQTNPNVKLASFSKGLGLGKTGALNFSGSYTSSAVDIRSAAENYQRETFSVIYSNTLTHNKTQHRFSVNLSGYMSDNKTKADPDKNSRENRSEYRDHSISAGFEGTLLFEKPWITNLKYSYRFELTNELSIDKRLLGGGNHSAWSYESGEFWADRQTYSFVQDQRNESRAISHYAQIMGDLVMGMPGKVMNTLTVGADLRSNGNTGRGNYFIPHYVEGGSTNSNDYRPEGFRSQRFDEIPFVNVVSFFAEDSFHIPLFGNRQSLTIEPGVRVNMILNNVLNNRTAIDPRVNMRYALVRNGDGIVRGVSLRGGFGRFSRLPDNGHMYQYTAYEDDDSEHFAWTDPNNPADVRRTVTTMVRSSEDMINPDLKIQYSNKFEVGFDLDIAGITAKFTYYNEKLRNGYETWSSAPAGSSITSLRVLPLRHYTDSWAQYNETRPVYMADPREDRPSDMVLSVDGVPLNYVVYNKISVERRPGNSYRYDKWGVEGMLVFPRINPLQTTVSLSGAFINVRDDNGKSAESFRGWSSTQARPGVFNPYVVSYIGSDGHSQGTLRKQLSTQAKFITHIPSLRMVATITIEAIWIDKQRTTPIEGLYHVGENGERIYGDYSNGWEGSTLFRDPAYYYTYNQATKQFERNVFTPDLYDIRANPDDVDDPLKIGDFLSGYMFSTNAGYQFFERSYKPYFMANINISKEIGRRATVSLYVNNFTDSHPRRFNPRDHQMPYRYMNSAIYFGGDIKFKF